MTSHGAPAVALVHATFASTPGAAAGFAAEFPQARIWNLLDDQLVVEADAAGGLTPDLTRRMLHLIDHAYTAGAAAVQLTCSMYGPAAAAASELYDIPVLGSDQAMFAAVADAGYRRVAVLGSLDSAVADSADRLAAAVRATGDTVPDIEGRVSAAAFDAAKVGDVEALRRAVADGVEAVAADVDAVLVAQYSLCPGLTSELMTSAPVPVLSPPHLAARALKDLLKAH